MKYQHINWLFDTVMPQVKSANAFEIICIVARKTWGWGKNSDMISISQFTKLSSIKTKTTTIKAIKLALDSGFISRQKVGQSHAYRMQFYEKGVQNLDQSASTETIPVTHKTSIETIPTSIETIPELVQNLDPQREKEYKQLEGLAKIFTGLTGFFMPSDYESRQNQEQWVKPLLAIHGQGECESRIKYAVDKMREGGYTIKAPKSILTFALNWNGNKNGQVTKTDDGGIYV